MAAKMIIHDTLFLKQKAEQATKEDYQVAIDLRDTLIAKRESAAGLAANMIGINKKIIAFYMGDLPIVMINPRIIAKSGRYSVQEGCLSLFGLRKTVRYQTITVEYQNLNFQTQKQSFSGFIAETIQHEVDHCAGILI
ncbi:peptide deformylase [Lactobacillus sp. ESL0731]|uniref:peptide deformylase n=1 Tax=unclassified Lactobacillus TaxID=2620435 RepID=UPI0023FA49B2|nr:MULTISPECIES: peptide deformylase [unclassified Lactobacillus]WEV51193.1 peptide deformylase [Lactobacillus sp. ESL0700]WEV62323.1 peptide deformylase [Lactobacillus sp. ESL0731]